MPAGEPSQLEADGADAFNIGDKPTVVGEPCRRQAYGGNAPTDANWNGPIWALHVGGTINADGAGAGTYLVSLEGCIIKRSVRLAFPATYNLAKCEELYEGLDAALALGATLSQVFSDSAPSRDSILVANQANEIFRPDNTTRYFVHARYKFSFLRRIKVSHMLNVEDERQKSTPDDYHHGCGDIRHTQLYDGILGKKEKM